MKLELASKHLMPQSARPIRAAWCPTLPSAEPEYVAAGSEDTAVYVYDITSALMKLLIRNLISGDGAVCCVCCCPTSTL